MDASQEAIQREIWNRIEENTKTPTKTIHKEFCPVCGSTSINKGIIANRCEQCLSNFRLPDATTITVPTKPKYVG